MFQSCKAIRPKLVVSLWRPPSPIPRTRVATHHRATLCRGRLALGAYDTKRKNINIGAKKWFFIAFLPCVSQYLVQGAFLQKKICLQPSSSPPSSTTTFPIVIIYMFMYETFLRRFVEFHYIAPFKALFYKWVIKPYC